MKIKFAFFSLLFFLSSCLAEFNSNQTNQTLSGSYANILIVDHFLYAVTINEMHTFKIQDNGDLEIVNQMDIGSNIESLLHYKGFLFVGSPSEMLIFQINNEGIPQLNSTTNYDLFGEDFCFSDPIAVTENYAYVTLSSAIENQCSFRQVNELRVYDISDKSEPQLLNTLNMEEPKGLAVDGNLLFVCEALDGLKIFDISKPRVPAPIYHFKNFKAFDVIPDNGILLVSGPEQIYQFNYTDPENIFQISQLDL